MLTRGPELMREFDCRQKSVPTTTKTNAPIHDTVTSKTAMTKAISPRSLRIFKQERPTPHDVCVCADPDRELNAERTRVAPQMIIVKPTMTTAIHSAVTTTIAAYTARITASRSRFIQPSTQARLPAYENLPHRPGGRYESEHLRADDRRVAQYLWGD